MTVGVARRVEAAEKNNRTTRNGIAMAITIPAASRFDFGARGFGFRIGLGTDRT